MKNKTVVFTGFRDAAMQKKVEDQGGRVTNAVSGKTDVLVVSLDSIFFFLGLFHFSGDWRS